VQTFAGLPSDDSGPRHAEGLPALQIRLLGPLAIHRGDGPLPLPTSRKVRALMAYLALSQRAFTRAHLCELLGDIPADPRGELRWCLSKARTVLDEPGRSRIGTVRDTVSLDMEGGFVDATEVLQAMQSGVALLDAQRLRALCALFAGDFLDGLEIDRSPSLNGWLIAQRRRFRGCHAALLEHLIVRLAPEDDEVFAHLEKWLALTPFDQRAHEALLDALARHGRVREGEEHLAETARVFDREGLDWRPLRDRWRQARGRQASVIVLPASAADGASAAPSGDGATPVAPPRRASIAVMPFVDRSSEGIAGDPLAAGLVHDIITRLAKLRSLFVIAQGTVFALDARRIPPEEAGRTLNVDYVVSGLLRRQGQRIVVNVELAETRTAHIVWADTCDGHLDDAFLVLDEIGDRIVASIAGEIETVERNRAILKPPNSLDAWEALHRGLWHMYRFNREDNERARGFFEMAVRLDPTFARAYAGLSFTHWQSAFQHWEDREPAVNRAFDAATKSLAVDDRDPAAHWAMGRALWLRGEQQPSLLELETAVELSPNFALGHYALAFVHSQSGDPHAALASSDRSRHLSPYDPLLFGMLGTRAMALVRLGRFDEAAEWALKAASRPNAHVHIQAIAAHCLALAGRMEEARACARAIHMAQPGYRVDDFLTAFRFAPDAVAEFKAAASKLGLD
jgi:TolB-like protein/DNA-binding SARP family transcriptional activator